MNEFPRSEEDFTNNFRYRFQKEKPKYITKNKIYNLELSQKASRNYDLALKIGNKVITIIEVKRNKSIQLFDFTKAIKYAIDNDIRYVILTDREENFTIRDTRNLEQTIRTQFEGFLVKAILLNMTTP